MKIRKRLLLVFALAAVSAAAQIPVLNEYIAIGIDNNLTLQQKEFSLQRSIAALNEARGMFLPSVSIEARYSRAGGGRVIEIPVGDLTNPIYHTLNDLLASVGQPPIPWTDIPNEVIPFLREEEHDTKIRLTQPIFQPALFYNYKIKRDLTEIAEASKRVFTRQLISDIKTAYFNYLKTGQIVQLLEKTQKLLEENIRVNESLYANDKATIAAVHRARAELYELQQGQAEAKKNHQLARSYFNFLLNRPMDAPVTKTPANDLTIHPSEGYSDAETIALQNREELLQLAKAVDISGHQVGLARSAFLPGLTVVADYGFQGESYRFTQEDDYWMASAVLQWNLFNGFQDKNRIRQAALDKKEKETHLEEIKKQIQLQAKENAFNLDVALKAITASKQRLISARKTYDIMDRKYREGMASQIEFIDARTTMTRAEINHIVAKYDYFIRRAEQEKILATYPIEEE